MGHDRPHRRAGDRRAAARRPHVDDRGRELRLPHRHRAAFRGGVAAPAQRARARPAVPRPAGHGDAGGRVRWRVVRRDRARLRAVRPADGVAVARDGVRRLAAVRLAACDRPPSAGHPGRQALPPPQADRGHDRRDGARRRRLPARRQLGAEDGPRPGLTAPGHIRGSRDPHGRRRADPARDDRPRCRAGVSRRDASGDRDAGRPHACDASARPGRPRGGEGTHRREGGEGALGRRAGRDGDVVQHHATRGRPRGQRARWRTRGSRGVRGQARSQSPPPDGGGEARRTRARRREPQRPGGRGGADQQRRTRAQRGGDDPPACRRAPDRCRRDPARCRADRDRHARGSPWRAARGEHAGARRGRAGIPPDARERARRRDRASARGGRGAPSGPARPAHRPPQPLAVHEPPDARPAAHRPSRRGGGAVSRPRPLQADQRQPRPPRRRRAAAHRRLAAHQPDADRRHGRALRRRRVLHHLRGRRPGRGDHARGARAPRARAAVLARLRRALRRGECRNRAREGPRPQCRGRHSRGGRGDVPRQGEGPRRLRGVRRGDAEQRHRASPPRSRPAPCAALEGRADRLLPADRLTAERRRHRPRGARALAASRARAAAPGRFHPDRRAERCDPVDRRPHAVPRLQRGGAGSRQATGDR